MALGDVGTDEQEGGDQVERSGEKGVSESGGGRENVSQNFDNLCSVSDPTSLTPHNCHAHQVQGVDQVPGQWNGFGTFPPVLNKTFQMILTEAETNEKKVLLWWVGRGGGEGRGITCER